MARRGIFRQPVRHVFADQTRCLPMPERMSDRDICEQCIAACEHCLALLDRQPGSRAGAALAEVLGACTRLCRQVVEEIHLNSAYVASVSRLCAVLCRACMEECSLHAGAPFARCAAACARAAEACRGIALGT
jgi:hypothetical protein